MKYISTIITAITILTLFVGCTEENKHMNPSTQNQALNVDDRSINSNSDSLSSAGYQTPELDDTSVNINGNDSQQENQVSNSDIAMGFNE